jgi:hypothetical protein
MGLKTLRMGAVFGLLLVGLGAPVGCGEQSATRTAPEPNVGPAGPSTGPAAGPAAGEKEKAPAK